MKKFISLLVLVGLLFSSICAAESSTILCLNCTINGSASITAVDGNVYTAIATLQSGESVVEWRLNGVTVPNAHDSYLTFTVKGNMAIEAVPGTAEEAKAAIEQEIEDNRPAVIVQTIGATLQYLDKNNLGSGDSYTELDFTHEWTNPVTKKTSAAGSGSFKVTADYPHSDRIDYWVIDGVRYDFNICVKTMNIRNLDRSMTIECVYKNQKSVTLNNPEYLRTPEAGEPLVVKSANSKMRHVKNTSTGDAKAFTEFDFSSAYKNAATGKTVSNGTIDLKVTANATGDTKVKSWEINGVSIVFNSAVNYMILHGLNTSTEFIAHYDGETERSGSSGSSGGSSKNDKNTEDRKNYCTVDCRSGCTFSGGTYSGAKKGDVPAGTVVTISSNIGNCHWKINGETYTRTMINRENGKRETVEWVASSITLVIHRWTIIEAY